MKKRKIQKNRGMTYVELIVVLSIFAIVASISMFNYSRFQQKVDIKNLANDIALRIVEAQKLSTSGKLPPVAQSPVVNPWRPSYGINFNLISNNKRFTNFVDLDQDKIYDTSACAGTGECLSQVTITKGNYISSMALVMQNGTTTTVNDNLTLSFTRPNSGLTIVRNNAQVSGVSYAQINLSSPNANNLANIKVYSSGRVQID